jgi:hypothetical protein
LHGIEAEGGRERIGVSYAGTFLLVPWQVFALAILAPAFLPLSCRNNMDLVGYCFLYFRMFLAMAAEKEKSGGARLSSSVGHCSGSAHLCRRGGGRMDGVVESAAPREDLAAAFDGVHQQRRSFAGVIHGRRGRSVLRCCGRRSLFNLLAGVPIWRPFCNSVMAFIVAPASSGFVPDDVADGRGMECIFFSGGVGLDCVFNTLLEVLHVKVDGLVVFIFSVEVIRVKCNPTE